MTKFRHFVLAFVIFEGLLGVAGGIPDLQYYVLVSGTCEHLPGVGVGTAKFRRSALAPGFLLFCWLCSVSRSGGSHRLSLVFDLVCFGLPLGGVLPTIVRCGWCSAVLLAVAHYRLCFLCSHHLGMCVYWTIPGLSLKNVALALHAPVV